MMTTRTSPTNVTLLLAGTLFAAGCGGEPSNETGSAQTTDAMTEAQTTTGPTPTGTETTEAPTGATTTPTDPPVGTTTEATTTEATTVEPTTAPDATTTSTVGSSSEGASSDEGSTSTGGLLSFAADIYPIAIDGFCSCHDGKGKLNLTTAELAYSSFVDVASNQVMEKIVAPGDAKNSYLLYKLDGTSGDLGGNPTQMPKDAAPLPNDVIAVVAQWIEDGALP